VMRDQPKGVSRKPRGDDHPPREYDVYVDGERAGWAERLPHGKWRLYYSADGDWQTFGHPLAFATGAQWLADLHRAARGRNAAVTVTGDAEVRALAPAVADPFSLIPESLLPD
jgi:hypothetical protein